MGFPPKPLCVFLGFVFVFSPPDDEKINRESRGLELGSRAERSMRKLISDGGEITKTRFGYFSRLLVCFRFLVSRLETIYEDRFYLKL